MFFDCTERVSRVDKQLVSEIRDECKPCIFVVNKWDLSGEMSMEQWSEYLFKLFADMRYVPVAFVTALTGRNVKKLIHLAQTIHKQARERVTTGELNRVIRAGIANWPPPMRQNRTAKILFATQVGTEPPTIVIKCNDAVLFDESWKRYLFGYLREHLPFQEVPVKVYFRSKGDSNQKPGYHPRETPEFEEELAAWQAEEQGEWNDADEFQDGQMQDE